jgi:hypothetical protein
MDASLKIKLCLQTFHHTSTIEADGGSEAQSVWIFLLVSVCSASSTMQVLSDIATATKKGLSHKSQNGIAVSPAQLGACGRVMGHLVIRLTYFEPHPQPPLTNRQTLFLRAPDRLG